MRPPRVHRISRSALLAAFPAVTRAVSGVVLSVSLSLLAAHAVAAGAQVRAQGRPAFGPHDVASVFFVSKSENRNEVHYALRLDAACVPRGDRPVFGYWRVVERSGALSTLTSREVSAYGVRERQPVTMRSDGAHVVRVALNALPRRELLVIAERTDAGCRARALTRIDGHRAELRRVHVQLGGLFGLGVDHLRLDGRRLSSGERVSERVEPE